MPASLTLSGLSWSTPDGTPLFSDITLSFGPGRTGLVGRNGCGKSTLLHLMAGEIEPAAGVVTRGGTVGWMQQDAGQPGDSVVQTLGIDGACPASHVCCAARAAPRTRVPWTGHWRIGWPRR